MVFTDDTFTGRASYTYVAGYLKKLGFSKIWKNCTVIPTPKIRTRRMLTNPPRHVLCFLSPLKVNYTGAPNRSYFRMTPVKFLHIFAN